MYISSLNIYPVKSLGGITPTNAAVTAQGLQGDRVWLLATPTGEMITARKYPQLLLWQTAYDCVSGCLNIHFPDRISLKTERTRFSETAQVQVWKDTFSAWHGDAAADELLSQQLGFAVRLYYLGEHSTRRLAHYDTPLTFADGAPFLLCNTASLADLNAALNTDFEMARFRANIVVSGCLPYAEENWRRVQIGTVVFEILKPCVRCVMPTIDLRNGEKHPQQQPLAYLAQQRHAIFGMNMAALNTGIIQVGDSISVLA